jgi:hypothetical protein
VDDLAVTCYDFRMIPYEDLCQALASYAARTRGEPVPESASGYGRGSDGDTLHGDPQHAEHTAFDAPDGLSAADAQPSLASSGADEDSTHVGAIGHEGGLEPVYDVSSQELDLGDVLPDEENH